MPEEGSGNSGVGVIYPPPDIRGVIDKTAQFVAKCGPEFEQRVLREQNHTKFAFLLPSNPYRPYYEFKVREFKTGVVEESKPEVPQAILEQKAKEAAKQQKKEQKMLTLGGERKKKVAKQPAPDQFVVAHPFIAPMDMDIIKLTAQFVARNGQKFLIGLTQRESRNPQFDFLKPTHALFGYFTSLVDAYTKCLMPNRDEVEKLKKWVAKNGGNAELLDRANLRFAWDEQEDMLRQSREDEEKEEKEIMNQIDWHDFVVVETIEFTAEDDNIALAAPIDTSSGKPSAPPVPLDQGGAGTMSAQARIEKPKGVEKEEREEPQVDLEIAEKEKRAKEDKLREDQEKEEAAVREAREDRERAERERELAEQEEQLPEDEPVEMEPEIPMPSMDNEMKVRKDYVRHRKASQQRIMQRCPITGQLIPAEEMSHHLKVLLLDPKWKHQKDALVERARKESAFADDVEANLAGFVAKRPDLFGSVDEEIREAAEAGAEASAREAGADAGPAHTMVPPAAQLTSGGGGYSRNQPALAAASAHQPALAAGPITGVSTINARLPSANQVQGYGQHQQAALPSATLQLADESDSDEEPSAKRPRTDDGSLVLEAQWIQKHPMPIQILVQVNLGADAGAASVPTVIPLELSVRSKILEMKHMLAPKVTAAGVNAGTMKLKAQSQGFLLKNQHSLAFYNIAPGAVLELTRKQRGGKK